MTTIQEAEEAILGRWVANWPDTVPYAFMNEAFNQEPPKPEWAAVFFEEMPSQQQTMGRVGNRKFHRKMKVNIRLFTLSNEGVARSNELGTLAQNIFEGARFGGLWFNAATIMKVGNIGTWFQTDIVAECNYEEVK